jgi:hypothetical protein
VPGLFLLFAVGSTIFAVVSRPVEGLVGLATLGACTGGYFVQRRRQSHAVPPGPPLAG